MKLTILLTLCTVSSYIGWNIGRALVWAFDPSGIVMAGARALVAIDDAMRELSKTLQVLR